MPTDLVAPIRIRVLQNHDLENPNDSQEDQWVVGTALRSFVFDENKTLMYVVEVNGEIWNVLFGFIETIYAHTETTIDENKALVPEGHEYEVDLESSDSEDELELLLMQDDLRLEDTLAVALNSSLRDERIGSNLGARRGSRMGSRRGRARGVCRAHERLRQGRQIATGG